MTEDQSQQADVEIKPTNSETLGGPGAGHNSEPDATVSGKRLKSFLERVERLEGEKSKLSEDIKEVYSEAKGTGFDPKIMRRIIRLRKMAVEKRREEAQLEDLYKSAIGME